MNGWEFVFGAILVAMWLILVFFLWEIHTVLVLNADAIQALIRQGAL